MSFLSWFSAGPKTAETLVDGAVRGLDALVLTEEEKIRYQGELADWWLKLQGQLSNESSVRSVTRRLIAFAVLLPYVGLIIAGAVVWPWYPEYAAFLLQLAESQFGLLAIGIGGFYFGPHMIGRARGKSSGA